MTQVIIHRDAQGNITGTDTIDDSPETVNQGVTMQNAESQAQAAITNLRAYIALPSPTAAQTTAVVKLLCRAMLQMIRIVLQRFDDSD